MAVDRFISTLADEEARLRSELELVASQLDRIKRDLDRLAKIKQVLYESSKTSGTTVDAKAASESEHPFREEARRIRARGPRSIKVMVMDVIHDSDRPLQAVEILERINKQFNVDIPRTSLSPQLSRLRDEGRLRYDPGTRSWGSKFHANDIFG